MADEEESLADGGISSASSSECRSCTSHSDEGSTLTEDFDLKKSGWLLKKSMFSKKWKKKWFILNGTELVYAGDSTEMAKKFKVPLSGSGIANCPVDERTNTFRLKPRGRRRALTVQAGSESEQQEWMEAICFAKAASHDKRNTLCVIQ